MSSASLEQSPFQTVKVLERLESDKQPVQRVPDPGAFPLEALNVVERSIVESAAEVYQIKAELPGMAAVATLAGAAGKSCIVHDAVNGRETYLNVYVLAGAPKSYGKGANAIITRPLIDASSGLADDFKHNEKPALLQEKRVLEKRMSNYVNLLAKVRGSTRKQPDPLSEDDKDRLRRELVEMQKRFDQIEPLVKQLPSYWIGNSTSAALAETLVRNDGSIFSFSPEAGELVRIALGKFSKDNAADFDLLLSGYTVEVSRETRIGRGDHELLPCISVLWFCQPFLLRELYANEEALERGLTARVLPFAVEHEVVPYDDGVIRNVHESVSGAWDSLIRNVLEARCEPQRIIRCTAEAKEVFRAFHNEAVDHRNGPCREVEGELGRWRENAIRVAAGRCLSDALTEGHVGEPLVLKPEQAERGVRIARWAHLSGLRFMENGRAERRLKKATDLARLAANYGGKVTLRDLDNRHGISHEVARCLAADFPHLLAVLTIKPETGRPSEVLTVADRTR